MAFLPPFWVAEWSYRFVLTVIADRFFLIAPPAQAKPAGICVSAEELLRALRPGAFPG
jgi:hypothetical protein